jgi:CubicO group peptidase (beta-lactamase class C family)
MSAARLDDARALMRSQLDSGRAPALVAVVARHGKPVFAEAFGDQRPGGPALTLDSVFPVASQTKPLVAAVIMCLAERGLVGLTEPAALTLPELAADHGNVLVTHLLTHTSGWEEEDHAAEREANLDSIIASIPEGADPLTHILLAPGWTIPRRREPGDQMSYCNFNYSLLGEIVRRVTGGTLDAALRRFIFEPLGMTSSAMIVGDELLPHVIERAAGVPGGPDHPGTAISMNDPLWAVSDEGASGVHTSAPDWLRFSQMILDEGVVGDRRILSRDAVRAMTTNRLPGVAASLAGFTRVEASWGLGFGVAGHEAWSRFGGGTLGPRAVRHGGAGGASGWIDPDRGIAAAYIEVVTEADEFNVPTSWAANRFEDVVTAAVLD